MISFSHWAKDQIAKETGSARVPLTYDFISHWARQTPQAPAVLINEGTIHYRSLERHVNVMTQALAKFGLEPGQVVFLSLSDFYTNLLMLIALENLGLVSAMASKRQNFKTDPLVLHSSLALCDEAVDFPNKLDCQLIDDVWLSNVLGQASKDISPFLHQADWNDGVRLSSSSGTSQEPKPILLSHEVQASWHQFYLDTAGYSASTRLFVAGALSVNVFYSRAVVCMRLGGAVMSNFELSRFDFFAPNAMCSMPLTLEVFLNRLPASFEKPKHLTVHTGGAALTESLRQRALQQLCSDIYNNYGCVETGVVSQMDEEKTGTLVADVLVQIVDELDQPLPIGQTGMLRVKSKTMIQSYWKNPLASAKSFRDGWFYPGDEAVMLSERRLKLMGRRDDLLNLGGIKVSPQPFEDALINLSWVRDAAFVAFGAAGDSSMGEHFGVALVLRDGIKPAQWMNEVIAVLQNLSLWISNNKVEPICIVLPALPYTDTGKVKRQQIRDLFKKEVEDRSKTKRI